MSTDEKSVQAMRWIRTEPLWRELEAWEAPAIEGRIALLRDGWTARAGGKVRSGFRTFGEASRWARTKRHDAPHEGNAR